MKTAKGGNNMKTAKVIVVGVEVAKRSGVKWFGCTVINAAQSGVKYDNIFVDEESFGKFKPKSFEELIKTCTKHKN
jgi:hypothetical protein